MKSLLEPFKDSMIVKVLIAIIMFFFTWISNTQKEKKSEFYKSIKERKNVSLENSLRFIKSKNTYKIILKNSTQL